MADSRAAAVESEVTAIIGRGAGRQDRGVIVVIDEAKGVHQKSPRRHGVGEGSEGDGEGELLRALGM